MAGMRETPGRRRWPFGAGGLGYIGVESLKALTAAMMIVLDRNQAALELSAATVQGAKTKGWN
jgi:NAD+-dependent secondary alcohol dehydrogenase Adh1